MMAGGTMPPGELLRKFASYPLQHDLAVALRRASFGLNKDGAAAPCPEERLADRSQGRAGSDRHFRIADHGDGDTGFHNLQSAPSGDVDKYRCHEAWQKEKNSRENESCVQANTRKGRPAGHGVAWPSKITQPLLVENLAGRVKQPVCGQPAAAGQHCRIIRLRGMNNAAGPSPSATPPPKGIDEQPLAVSCGEIRNMHIGARYAVAVDTGVNQPCYRPKVIAASNTDCKLPLTPSHPPSVAVAEPSARLLIQQEI